MQDAEAGRRSRRRVAHACDTCKRRKERCNGEHPCARCIQRRAQPQCHFSSPIKTSQRSIHDDLEHTTGFDDFSVRQRFDSITQEYPEPPLEHTRLIRDSKGRYMFIGDSANLSFLQSIRRLVESCVGCCSFVDDPLRALMVEATHESPSSSLQPNERGTSLSVTVAEARRLINRYLLATNCILDLFDGSDLLQHVESWITGNPPESAPPGAVYYLVLAIGAQTSAEDQDALAASLFNRGRDLTSQRFIEDASIRTIQLYALMTMYLLGACRRNAAFMYLGTAVRAAYAIGLHQKEIAAVFPPVEFETRERLWKVLRILDLFMSASLGRPPSTHETRDTTAGEDYSASNDLCAIFELILTDVYSKRSVSTAVLSNIGTKHRKWAAKFFEGLSADKIAPTELIRDGTTPNIGLLHVKEAYYWTIILLTRPFLSETVMLHAQNANRHKNEPPQPCTIGLDTNHAVLVHACVNSAIRTIELLQPLLNWNDMPKRLPFVVNSLFIASLVLGCAYLGDLYQTVPLAQHMKLGRELLAQFKQDAIAQRNAAIIGYLQEACATWVEKRNAQRLDIQGQVVGVMFGQIHRMPSRAPTRAQTPSNTSQVLQRNGIIVDGTGLQHAESDIPDLAHMLAEIEDFAAVPYPVMEPHTIHFDAYGEAPPLFLTVSEAYNDRSNFMVQ